MDIGIIGIVVAVLAVFATVAIGGWQIYLMMKHHGEQKFANEVRHDLVSSFAKMTNSNITELKVVSDPRFIDSLLFLWIFSGQPLKTFGIQCELIPANWNTIPEEVANHKNSIGFFNRRSSTSKDNKALFEMKNWSDLCIYKGYSLIARNGSTLPGQMTIKEANDYIRMVIEKYKDIGKKPSIICMGADTIWKIITPVSPSINLNNFDILPFNNADVALNAFLSGKGDFFIGGLPQRLSAVDNNCIEILSFKNNPLFFSLNSMICSNNLFYKEKALLSFCNSLWFNVVGKMKEDVKYCDMVARSCISLLEKLKVGDNNIREQYFRDVFINRSNEYEIFPMHSSGVIDELLIIFDNNINSFEGHKHTTNKTTELLNHIRDVLNPNVEN